MKIGLLTGGWTHHLRGMAARQLGKARGGWVRLLLHEGIIQPALDESGAVAHFVAIMRDIAGICGARKI